MRPIENNPWAAEIDDRIGGLLQRWARRADAVITRRLTASDEKLLNDGDTTPEVEAEISSIPNNTGWPIAREHARVLISHLVPARQVERA